MRKVFLVLVVLAGLVVSSWWLLDRNVLFHSDIARDFYLMKEVVETKKPTLIGPRSGGIAGLFHGPAWIYVNLPFFWVSGGNPIVVAGWWWVLHLLTIGLVMLVSNKLAGKMAGLWAGAVYSVSAALDPHSFNNPQGAVVLSSLWFYLVYRFWEKPTAAKLFWAYLVTGFLIQFQAAFGGPMLLFLILLTKVKILKTKNFSLILGLLGLGLPLLTYVGFEMRHDWLQTRSVLAYITKSGGGLGFLELLLDRFKMLFYLGFRTLTKYGIVVVAVVPALIFGAYRNKVVKLFLVIYVWYWLVSLVFKSQMPVWYYNQFLPIMVVVLGVVAVKVKKMEFVLGLIIMANLFYNYKDVVGYLRDVNKQVWTSWKSLETAGSWVKKNCGEGFGLYTYTPDLYGYPLRYAVEYKMNGKGYLVNQKRVVVCVLAAPNVTEHPTGFVDWMTQEVKIYKKPELQFEWGNGIKAQKYSLNVNEINTPSNPLMIKDVFFR